MASLLAPGTVAPDFTARDQDGNLVRLADHRGRPVVLYFYPADDTPGCTREACAFRDRIEAFRSAGALVFGVSTQDEASHREFRDKYALNFPLLADPTKELCRRYNALGLLGVAKRITYVIGPEGTIRAAFHKVDPKAHEDEALRAVAAIQGGTP